MRSPLNVKFKDSSLTDAECRGRVFPLQARCGPEGGVEV